jgi:hypothetical protein
MHRQLIMISKSLLPSNCRHRHHPIPPENTLSGAETPTPAYFRPMTYPPPPPPGSQPGYPPPPPGQPGPGYGPPPATPKSKPFYKKWWFWVAAVVVVGIIAASANSGGDKKDDNKADGANPSISAPTSSSSKSSTSASKKPTSGISKGLGAKDATKDVKVSPLMRKKDGFGGTSYEVNVTIINHSSKRSDYFVTLSLESADGKTQIDTGNAVALNLEPDQTKANAVTFLEASIGDTKVPATARVVIKELQRTASS